jgi:nuclear pore complex protein Nup85
MRLIFCKVSQALASCRRWQCLYYLADASLLFSYSGAIELLQRLQEIFTRVEQGSGDDYLAILTRTIGGGEKEALNHLKTVRLGLARYFARCTVIGVGGKHVTERRFHSVA